MNDFREESRQRILAMQSDSQLGFDAQALMRSSIAAKYSYNFFWLGRPIIQYPQDMVALQEIIWAVRPDLIIETGIAHGGSLVLSASMLALLDYCDAAEAGRMLDPRAPVRRVLGIDIDIRAHNRTAIEAHPMAHRIDMLQGSSIASDIVAHVHQVANQYERVLVILDSNHTHDHVLAELRAYAPLASLGSYCVVFDTVIEDVPDQLPGLRPWGKGNNPKTAVYEFLRNDDRFQIDRDIQTKIQITVAPDGYLRRVS
jgi:cephalosporin hydroxylase